jgi:hypothetical protein
MASLLSQTARSLSHITQSVWLTARSFAFIARNGTKPDGLVTICRVEVPLAAADHDLYRKLVQLETERLEMPAEPRMVLNFIQVADPDYRELQVMVRASYRGQDRWYLHHILINNFFGWIYGLKDYGYNKYLRPLDFELDDGAEPLRAVVPANEALLTGCFRADADTSPIDVDDDGSYSIKVTAREGKLLYCKSATSENEVIRMDNGFFEVTTNQFIDHSEHVAYPTDWARLVPPGSYPAGFYVGRARDVSMAPLELIERWPVSSSKQTR